jgi:glucose-1-phosphate adenylyltransferase
VPGEPEWAFASMGNYVFTTEALREAIIEDNKDEKSRHDMGGSIIPMFVDQGSARVYNFNDNLVPSQTEREYGYWRDVGTLDAYFHASMDLVTVDPIFDLYNEDWPILTWAFPHPPAKFVHDHEGRRGFAAESLVSAGAIVSGAEVRRSIISPEVRLHSYSTIEDSVLFDGVDVGRRAVVKRAIIDKGVVVPPDYQIGVDTAADRERFTVSDEGIVVIGKNDKLE